MPIRVFLADDHTLTREGLRLLLERQEDIDVIGDAASIRTALQMIQDQKPDVVLMEANLLEGLGANGARKIVKECNGTRVIALSAHAGEKRLAAILQAGVAGYLTQESAFRDVCQAIRSVAAGRMFLSPTVTDLVVKGFLHTSSDDESPDPVDLTRREAQVLKLLAAARSTKEIAAQLGISPRTVETHRRRIIEKTGIKDVAALTRFAVRTGVTDQKG
jgi:DNA-binding NarL/FixJ family response regulator